MARHRIPGQLQAAHHHPAAAALSAQASASRAYTKSSQATAQARPRTARLMSHKIMMAHILSRKKMFGVVALAISSLVFAGILLTPHVAHALTYTQDLMNGIIPGSGVLLA